jgi:hypothetical protein
MWTGTAAIEGRGVRVGVSGPITADAVNDLLDELRLAGAEAISIEDVRVVTGTIVSGRPADLVVEGVDLGSSFDIVAIGSPPALQAILDRPGGIVSRIAVGQPDVLVDVTTSETPMQLPATQHPHPEGRDAPHLTPVSCRLVRPASALTPPSNGADFAPTRVSGAARSRSPSRAGRVARSARQTEASASASCRRRLGLAASNALTGKRWTSRGGGGPYREGVGHGRPPGGGARRPPGGHADWPDVRDRSLRRCPEDSGRALLEAERTMG